MLPHSSLARFARWLALPAMLGLLFVPLPVAVANAPQAVCTVQSTPYYTEYYGDLLLDGASASIDTLVEAVNGQGVQAGCFVVTIPGIYGYMRVYGADPDTGIPGMAANETVTFKVNGAMATSTPSPVHWSNDKSQHEVDLSAVSLPAAVDDLRASKSGVNVALTWSDVGSSADHYEVWRSTSPHFAPNLSEASLIAPNVPRAAHAGDPVNFPDEYSHLGNADINDYYVVLAVSSGGAKSLVSNRVGAFDFRLTPGGS